jgi:predicted secreted protein
MRGRSRLLVCFAVFLGLWAAAGSGWANQAAPAQVLTEKDGGKTVTLRVGERLVLNLRNPGDGGYSVVTPVYNKSVLKLASRETLPPKAATPPRMGDWGRIVFTWEAAGAGETDLTVQISREWEKEKPPLDYVKVRVRVIK